MLNWSTILQVGDNSGAQEAAADSQWIGLIGLFLLAADPGTGKTIMAGLLIQDPKARGLIKRILIVAPANLTFQWQGELHDKFRQDFEVVRRAVLRTTYGYTSWLGLPCSIAKAMLKSKHSWRPSVDRLIDNEVLG